MCRRMRGGAGIDVKPVQYLAEQGIEKPPAGYLLPKPIPSFHSFDTASIPVINLKDERAELVQAAGDAFQEWGCVQVRNHGIRASAMAAIMASCRHFYNVPVKAKMPYFTPFFDSSPMRYSTSFNTTKDSTFSWKDILRLPADSFPHSMDHWPPEDHFPRNKSCVEYFEGIRCLAMVLYGLVSESLGLEADYIEKALQKHWQVAGINFYPPCPQPSLTIGMMAHTDPNAITILLEDEVGGIQVYNRKQGQWLSVKPHPNALLVFLGDQIEIMSNGIYKSVPHRTLSHKSELRISIATFMAPSYDSIIGPAPILCSKKFSTLYKTSSYKEYLEEYAKDGLRKGPPLQSL